MIWKLKNSKLLHWVGESLLMVLRTDCLPYKCNNSFNRFSLKYFPFYVNKVADGFLFAGVLGTTHLVLTALELLQSDPHKVYFINYTKIISCLVCPTVWAKSAEFSTWICPHESTCYQCNDGTVCLRNNCFSHRWAACGATRRNCTVNYFRSEPWLTHVRRWLF